MKTLKQSLAALLIFTPFAAGAVPIGIDFDIVATEGSVSGTFTGEDTDLDGTLIAAEILSFTATATGTAFTGGPFTIDAAEAVIELFDFQIATLGLNSFTVSNGSVPLEDRERISLSGTSLSVSFGLLGSGRPVVSIGVTRLPTSVPEPGTLALLGIGLAGIGLGRRRGKA